MVEGPSTPVQPVNVLKGALFSREGCCISNFCFCFWQPRLFWLPHISCCVFIVLQIAGGFHTATGAERRFPYSSWGTQPAHTTFFFPFKVVPPDFYPAYRRVNARKGVYGRSVYACTDLYGPFRAFSRHYTLLRAYTRGKNQVDVVHERHFSSFKLFPTICVLQQQGYIFVFMCSFPIYFLGTQSREREGFVFQSEFFSLMRIDLFFLYCSIVVCVFFSIYFIFFLGRGEGFFVGRGRVFVGIFNNTGGSITHGVSVLASQRRNHTIHFTFFFRCVLYERHVPS